MGQIIATVSQLNNFIKRTFEANPAYSDIWIKGEISNYKKHYSGHHYLTLKDEGGVVKAVMFKQNATCLKIMLSDGMKVLAHGRVSVYEPAGTYQLYIDEIVPDGVGELYIAFENLKKKLDEEGLFLDVHKKPIPKFPQKVGVVTAPTGAAVRDIINIATRRYPYAEIIICPAQVQGDGAAQSICEGIDYFNMTKGCDVMIVGRGGGSIEDLWAFNEEIVAYSIFNSQIPVISAVGHEVDFTIADFVADLRAPTPSAAAELAVPSTEELLSYINNLKHNLKTSVNSNIQNKKMYLKSLKLMSPRDIIENNYLRLDMVSKRITDRINILVKEKKESFEKQLVRLDAISPLKIMKRGFALPVDEKGKIIKSVKTLDKKGKFELKMADGIRRCEVINNREERE